MNDFTNAQLQVLVVMLFALAMLSSAGVILLAFKIVALREYVEEMERLVASHQNPPSLGQLGP